jgi:hypothetical protein
MSMRDDALRQLLHDARSTTLGLTTLAQLLDNALAPSEARARQHVGTLSRAAIDLEATLARARSLLRPPRPAMTLELAPLVRDAFTLVYQSAPELPLVRVVAEPEALSLCLAELVSTLARDGRTLQLRVTLDEERVQLAFASDAPPPAELTVTIVQCLAERAGVECKLVMESENGTLGRLELRRARGT